MTGHRSLQTNEGFPVASIRTLVLALVAAIGTFGCDTNRSGAENLDKLYREAAGFPGYVRGESESAEAVRQISTYEPAATKHMFIDLATANVPLPMRQPQVEATKVLAGYGDPESSEILSRLVVPHESIEIINVTTSSLAGHPCPDDCIRNIMSYLEREDCGNDVFFGRRFDDLSSAGISMYTEKEYEKIRTGLYRILVENPVSYLAVLKQSYGLV